jgi:hypothetical protein
VFDLSRVARWQNQKRAAVLTFVAASRTLLLCSLILSVPSIDDALTGRPEYLRWITDRTARAVAASPVIARHDDAYDCDRVGNISAGDSDDILHVFTYSETSHSLCFVTYQRARESVTQSSSEVLSSNSGQNYGRQLSTPIAAVPVGHLSIKFPESYLTLLHWKRHVNAALLARAGNAQLRQAMPPSMSVLPVDVSLQLAELREAVAQRHNAVNAVLLAYYKLRLDVWCDWDPEDCDLEEIAQNISAGDAICTRRKVIAVVDRPQDIEDEAAMSFFGGDEGDADLSQG